MSHNESGNHDEPDNLDPGISNEELCRIERSSEWSSTEEVLARLEKLRQSSSESGSQ
jgi:hypothetical protein